MFFFKRQAEAGDTERLSDAGAAVLLRAAQLALGQLSHQPDRRDANAHASNKEPRVGVSGAQNTLGAGQLQAVLEGPHRSPLLLVFLLIFHYLRLRNS